MILWVLLVAGAIIYGILSAVTWAINKTAELEDQWIKDYGA